MAQTDIIYINEVSLCIGSHSVRRRDCDFYLVVAALVNALRALLCLEGRKLVRCQVVYLVTRLLLRTVYVEWERSTDLLTVY